jgi:tRNA (guanine26-N2/guanine27-N2)-dimethyltransferase
VEYTEGSAVFKAGEGKVSKSMGVFYNPVMGFNRSITVVALRAIPAKDILVALPMEASGVRGIRILKEVTGKTINVSFNDLSKQAVTCIKKNLKMNKIKEGFNVHCGDASMFLLDSKGFGFIDVDPFGSPNPFLDAAVKRVSRGGVLAVTATDTAPLAGTYPSACIRKYWARPERNGFMHETGLRILIRKIQLVGAQYDKALTPVFSYYREHYFRIFFQCEKSKQGADKLLSQHGWLAACPKCLKRFTSTLSPPLKCSCASKLSPAGPLWLGALWDTKLVQKMRKCATPDTKAFLDIIYVESKVNAIGFYSLGEIGKRFKRLPTRQSIIDALNKKGFPASTTHFSPEAIAISGNPDLKRFI